MTCRERLKLEHPEYIDDQNTLDIYAGGCCGCPDDHAYLDPPEFCTDKDISMEERCRRCWDRTIPENEEEPKCEKPPLGVMPKYIWDKKRLSDLASAIQRYIDAEKAIPKEWVGEYNELISALENN